MRPKQPFTRAPSCVNTSSTLEPDNPNHVREQAGVRSNMNHRIHGRTLDSDVSTRWLWNPACTRRTFWSQSLGSSMKVVPSLPGTQVGIRGFPTNMRVSIEQFPSIFCRWRHLEGGGRECFLWFWLTPSSRSLKQGRHQSPLKVHWNEKSEVNKSVRYVYNLDYSSFL